MRRYVVDANVVAAFFREDVRGEVPPLSAPAAPVFAILGAEAVAYLDNGGHIEQEWRGPVDEEWFDVWLARLLTEGAAQHTTALNDGTLRQALRAADFPVRSRDIWYVRTAHAITCSNAPATIITEDAHFIDPSAKRSPVRRARAIRSCSGPVAHLLSRNGIRVATLCRCIENTP